MVNEELAAELLIAKSCGLHDDCTSIVYEPIKQLIGEGGLTQNNAVQYAHMVFALHNKLKGEGKCGCIIPADWKHLLEEEKQGDYRHSTKGTAECDTRASDDVVVDSWI